MLCLALLLQISISITFSFFNPSSTSSWDPKHFTMATIQRCFLCPSRPTALWLYATLNEWLDLYTASSTIHQSGYCTCTYTHTHIQTCACAHTHTHTYQQTHDRQTYNSSTHITGAGIAQWLERRTRDWKVAGSNPCGSGGIIFFSRVNFLCWLLFR